MRIVVQGQSPLQGDYIPSGNSNAAIATIAASLLSAQATTLHHIPNTLSTNQMLQIAMQLGTSVSQIKPTVLRLETPHINTRSLNSQISNNFAPSILFLAPIIARRGFATLEWSDALTRWDPHLNALQDLGLSLEIKGTSVSITAETWDTIELVLTLPSVTATALVCMLAAVLGKKTILNNAASEPHLRILQHQLVQMGAKIEGIGSNLVTIYGIEGEALSSSIDLPPDHIEIASIAAIGALTKGQVSIRKVYLPDIRISLKAFERLGVQYYLQPDPNHEGFHILHVPDQNSLKSSPIGDSVLTIDTAPWPGFPSDLVAITAVLASQVRGTTLIHEKLFNNRLLFTDKLKAMGAKILLCDPHRAIVIGKSPLQSEYIDSPDVRVGLALLGAALCAEGQSTIDNAQLIDRTFERVIEKLIRIGAKIEVVPT